MRVFNIKTINNVHTAMIENPSTMYNS